MTAGAPLAGRRVAVVGDAGTLLRACVDALVAAGAATVTIGDGWGATGGARAIPWRDGTPAGAAAAVAEAAGSGPLDLLLVALLDPAALPRRPLVEVDADGWRSTVERPIEVAAAVCAAGIRAMGDGGRIVVVTPTISQFGAAGLVAAATAYEAMRIMAKSAARGWGRHGVTVNCLAPDLAALGVGGDDSRPRSLSGPSLDGVGAPAVADAVVTLAAGGLAALTGATLTLDGGVWMG